MTEHSAMQKSRVRDLRRPIVFTRGHDCIPCRPSGPRPAGRGSVGGPQASYAGRKMSDLWPRIEPLLARVEKPARYIGMERGQRSAATRGAAGLPSS